MKSARLVGEPEGLWQLGGAAKLGSHGPRAHVAGDVERLRHASNVGLSQHSCAGLKVRLAGDVEVLRQVSNVGFPHIPSKDRLVGDAEPSRHVTVEFPQDEGGISSIAEQPCSQQLPLSQSEQVKRERRFFGDSEENAFETDSRSKPLRPMPFSTNSLVSTSS